MGRWCSTWLRALGPEPPAEAVQSAGEEAARGPAARVMEAAGTAFVSTTGTPSAAAAQVGAVQGSPAAALAAVVAEAVAGSVGSTAEMEGLGTVVAVLRSEAGTLEEGEKVRAEAKRAEAGQEAPAGGVV